jgi:hypothetical protein
MEGNGFSEGKEDAVGSVVFRRLDVFFAVSYELELVPQDVQMLLGIGEDYLHCVPYWYLLPHLRTSGGEMTTGFRSEAELEAVLVGCLDRFIEPHAKPLWLDVNALRGVISRFSAEHIPRS